MKACRSCGVEKPFSEFIKDKNRPDGHYVYCKLCNTARRKEKQYDKAWRKSNPAKVVKNRRTGLLKKYGLTEDDYNNLLAKQNYACAICKSTDPNDRWNRFHIDHCHTSGKVRGLLCTQCNTGLGKFYDNIKSLSTAIEYLKSAQE